MPTRATRWMLVAAMSVGVAGCNREEPSVARTETPASQATVQRDDTWITRSVQAKYYGDDVMRGRNITVDANAGVVTLRGTVETDQAKQQAVALAKSVEGVTSVNDELRVDSAAATTAEKGPVVPGADTVGTAGRDTERAPAWITTKIQAQYFLNPGTKPWNIDVTTNSAGVVILEGEVSAADDKAEAVRIARETEGVTRVEDRLRVKGAAPDPADPGRTGTPAAGTANADPWVTAKIQAKYFVDGDVKGRNINVNTNNGVVTLNGTVANEAERRQAVALARNTDGVREVTDQLKVDTTLDPDPAPASTAADRMKREEMGRGTGTELKRPDPWITTKIQAKYFLDADVKGHEINVDTNNGIVTLKGTVASAAHKQEAEEIARETEGVKRVVNQLTVQQR